jgi:hypothetical protein
MVQQHELGSSSSGMLGLAVALMQQGQLVLLLIDLV